MNIKVIRTCTSIHCEYTVTDMLDSLGCMETELTVRELLTDVGVCELCDLPLKFVLIEGGD